MKPNRNLDSAPSETKRGANQRDTEKYSDEEAYRRAETAIRAAFGMPAKPQSKMKVGKRRRSAREL